MISPSTTPKTFCLTPTQRIHLEIYGYVVVENVLSPAEVNAIKDAMYAIEEEYHRTEQKPSEHMFFSSTSREFFRVDNLPHLHPVFNDYLTDPRIVGMAEDAVGGSVRLEQSDAHIRRYESEEIAERYGWHRGFDPAFSYTRNGLHHYPFMKCLTNLTDLGPDDGGTSVIAGTHKLGDIPESLLKQCAAERADMIHQVVAPAGSTLVFFESLLHSGGICRSRKERLPIIGGYAPDFFQPWFHYEPDPEFVATLPEDEQPFYTGSRKYHWTKMPRDLRDEV